MRRLNLFAIITCLSIVQGCAIKSSLTEDADPWTPQNNGTPVGNSPDEARQITEEDLKKLKSSKEIEDFVKAKLIGNDDTITTAELKTNVKIILAGDSWSFFDAFYGATESKLQTRYPSYQVEYFDYVKQADGRLKKKLMVIPGSTADEWTNPNYSQMIVSALNTNQQASVVVVYLGGNDWIDHYKCDQPGPVNSAIEQVGKDIRTLFKFIQDNVKASQPQRKLSLILVGYSKLNFEDSLKCSKNEERYRSFNFVGNKCGNGTPNPTLQINTSLKNLGNTSETYVHSLNGSHPEHTTYYINNHNIFGADDNKPTANERMIWIDAVFFGSYHHPLFLDSIHLGRKAQHKIAEKIMQHILDNNLVN